MLEDTCTIVGTVLAMLGLLAASPDGTRHAWRKMTTPLARRMTWARVKLAKWFPRLAPRSQTVSPGGIGIGFAVGRPTVTSTGHGWVESWTVDEKIDKLRDRANDIERRLNLNIRQLAEERSERVNDIGELRQTIAAETHSIRDHIRRTEQTTAAFNADLLPAVALGVVIAGLAKFIAAIPWHIGWVFPALGFFYALVAARSLWRVLAGRVSP